MLDLSMYIYFKGTMRFQFEVTRRGGCFKIIIERKFDDEHQC